MRPCPDCAWTSNGTSPADTIVLAFPSTLALLTGTDNLSVSGIVIPELTDVEIPAGRRCVPAGKIPVPRMLTGSKLAGKAPIVCCQLGPPTSISDPPCCIQRYKALNCSCVRLLV